MYNDSTDPYDGGGWGGSGGSGGSGGTGDSGDGGTTGGTDPSDPPNWTPGGNGWWEFWAGAWRWVTDPAPRAIRI